MLRWHLFSTEQGQWLGSADREVEQRTEEWVRHTLNSLPRSQLDWMRNREGMLVLACPCGAEMTVSLLPSETKPRGLSFGSPSKN